MKKSKFSYLKKRKYLSNDDVCMLKDKKTKKKDDSFLNVCDRHIDGA